MRDKACEEFLKVANQFKLGTLETEKPHPLTTQLSKEAQTNLHSAVDTLKQVDTEALKLLESYLPDIAQLGGDIQDTLNKGGRVFLCGCGATGRLSISLEVFCREGLINPPYEEQFVGFMAGGDAALIKSIENFEDRPEYGAKQLEELGFRKEDLLISTTEGGETPFVIGATEAAAQRSDRKPWFLYCNPRAQLLKEIERSSRVLKNSAIKSLSLFVGSMGLSGSTRMQASTVLMASVGWAIQYGENQETIKQRLQQFRQTWEDLSLFPLGKFTKKEAVCYQKSEYVIYNTKSFGVTVLTDTTERAPTFALSPFENVSNPADPPGWCYLSVPSAANSEIAWHHILKRKPRCLEWKEIKSFVGLEYLNGFTIGQNCLAERTRKTKAATQHLFDIEVVDQGFQFNFEEHNWRIRAPKLTFFEHNLLLKLVLNIHSTLVMGILGRFESNLMTYVKPSNFKLIDRSIRYVQQLSTLEGNAEPDYSLVAETLFALKKTLPPDEPIVLRVLEALKSR